VARVQGRGTLACTHEIASVALDAERACGSPWQVDGRRRLERDFLCFDLVETVQGSPLLAATSTSTLREDCRVPKSSAAEQCGSGEREQRRQLGSGGSSRRRLREATRAPLARSRLQHGTVCSLLFFRRQTWAALPLSPARRRARGDSESPGSAVLPKSAFNGNVAPVRGRMRTTGLHGALGSRTADGGCSLVKPPCPLRAPGPRATCGRTRRRWDVR